MTLITALKVAQSMDAAEVNVTKLQSKEASAPINRTETAHTSEKKTCYRCGGYAMQLVIVNSMSIPAISARKKATWRKYTES